MSSKLHHGAGYDHCSDYDFETSDHDNFEASDHDLGYDLFHTPNEYWIREDFRAEVHPQRIHLHCSWH
jgi:hypothetical protein